MGASAGSEQNIIRRFLGPVADFRDISEKNRPSRRNADHYLSDVFGAAQEVAGLGAEGVDGEDVRVVQAGDEVAVGDLVRNPLDGAPVAKFGKFGLLNAEDFVGCCNPVNVAIAPDGGIVTAEKVAARVKVFDRDRSLLAVIGPEHFDPMCRHIHIAVDSTGRIVAADPERRTIAVFGRS